ncbi:MAG: S8 family serine peptidase [Synergistales bacterium]|nr:S8 family serine peptidase [Synergistales bacterium]
MNKKNVLPVLFIIVVSLVISFPSGVLQAREYVLLHGEAGMLSRSSTSELVAGAGLDIAGLEHVYSGLRGGRIELDEKEVDLLLSRYPDMVLIPADICLYPSLSASETFSLDGSDVPWHVILAESLSEYVSEEDGDFTAQKVFVLDSGVDEDHPDLVACLDLAHARNFTTADPGDISDVYGHGTNVSGVIAGSVTGVSPSSKVVPLKVADPDGSLTTAILTDAIDYVIGLKNGELSGMNMVVNLSYNSPYATYSPDSSLGPYFRELLLALEAKGILFVSSAGNNAADIDRYYVYPTSNESAIYVSAASVQSDGSLASTFTNYGTTTVEIAAPGSFIETTGLSGSYALVSGTSFSSPFASGIASMIWALEPSLEAWEVRNLLINAVKGVEIDVDFIQEYTGQEGDYLFLAGSSFLAGESYGDDPLDIIAGKALYPSAIANDPLDPAKAYDPYPANGQGHVPLELTLSWKEPEFSESADVYFGPSEGSLELIADDIIASSVDISDLDPETSYFWRVDSGSGGQITTGDLWAFSTVILEAYDPYPVDGAINVSSSDVTLSWDHDLEGVAFDVFLGTSSAEVGGTQPSALVAEGLSEPFFHAGDLDDGTTWYWAVRTVYAGVPGVGDTTRLSPVWSFTTGEDEGLIPSGGSGGCWVGNMAPSMLFFLLPLIFILNK